MHKLVITTQYKIILKYWFKYKNMHIKWVSTVFVVADLWCWHENCQLHCQVAGLSTRFKNTERITAVHGIRVATKTTDWCVSWGQWVYAQRLAAHTDSQPAESAGTGLHRCSLYHPKHGRKMYRCPETSVALPSRWDSAVASEGLQSHLCMCNAAQPCNRAGTAATSRGWRPTWRSR